MWPKYVVSLPWDPCSLKHITMRGSLSNRPHNLFRVLTHRRKPRGNVTEEKLRFHKENPPPAVVYFLWSFYWSMKKKRSCSLTLLNRQVRGQSIAPKIAGIHYEGHKSRCSLASGALKHDRLGEGHAAYTRLHVHDDVGAHVLASLLMHLSSQEECLKFVLKQRWRNFLFICHSHSQKQ